MSRGMSLAENALKWEHLLNIFMVPRESAEILAKLKIMKLKETKF